MLTDRGTITLGFFRIKVLLHSMFRSHCVIQQPLRFSKKTYFFVYCWQVSNAPRRSWCCRFFVLFLHNTCDGSPLRKTLRITSAHSRNLGMVWNDWDERETFQQGSSDLPGRHGGDWMCLNKQMDWNVPSCRVTHLSARWWTLRPGSLQNFFLVFNTITLCYSFLNVEYLK